MTISNTPRAWAKLRAHAYRYGGISIYGILAMNWLGILPVGLADDVLAAIILAVLAVNIPHIWAILTGDQQQQQIEKQAWADTRFRWAPQFWTSSPFASLREVGAIGIDLTRTRTKAAGRQSGGHQTGAGGHKKPASSGSDDDGEGEPPAHLPLIWTIHDLAATLAVSAKTLQNQPPHHLPPAIRIPGCRGPRYRLQDVLAWLDGFSAGQRPSKPLPRKVRGRPRIASAVQMAAVRGEGV
jgi:hypothetical protein